MQSRKLSFSFDDDSKTNFSSVQQADEPEVECHRARSCVVGVPIDVIGWDETIEKLSLWARQRKSRTVCLCNVHVVMTANEDPELHAAIRQTDLALPDGAPIAWSLRRSGHRNQSRISGPDVMWSCLQVAELEEQVVSFYGDTDITLNRLRRSLLAAFPRLRIGVMISPPFRPLTPAEDEGFIKAINSSGTQTLFVGLGCPKQELWMFKHHGSVDAVMMGVGAAFAFHAGMTSRAPEWMRHSGLEWLHRLAMEPRRLAKRYLVTNSRFISAVAMESLKSIMRGR